jgi:hypothetical protein
MFDVTQSQPPDISQVLMAAVISFLVGVVVITLGRRFRRHGMLSVGVLVSSFGLLLFVGPLATRQQFHKFVRDYLAGHYSVAEGIVEDFRPMPQGGHALESFSINGRQFTYSDFIASPGFHQTRLKGGPIQQGVRARIFYIGNDIARVEVANPTANEDL